MSSFKIPDLAQRNASAAEAKKGLLEKFRQASGDPGIAERLAARAEIARARAVREEKRAAERLVLQAQKAEEARQAAERAAEMQREVEASHAQDLALKAEKDLALLAEQKAARDERYAARKAAKKERRKG